MTEVHRLLLEIADCSVAGAIRKAELSGSHPCHEVVNVQSGPSFQRPEPWSGRIDTALILFISSNPSLNEDEKYPTISWPADAMTDFFHERFTSTSRWVDNRLRVLRSDDSWEERGVSFWASARMRAAEVLQKKSVQVLPGVDFALTEVVHCKSRKEQGAEEALRFCAGRYLKRILSLSSARVLIVFGKLAAEGFGSCLGAEMNPLSSGVSAVSIAGIPRVVAFLPHPNRPGPAKSLIENIGEEGLRRIRRHLRGDE